MAGRLAILSFAGQLPGAVLNAEPDAYVATFQGTASMLQPTRGAPHRFERLGELVNDLQRVGADRVVMAGHLARPELDPDQFDRVTLAYAQQLVPALKQEDDVLLSRIVGFFEEMGIDVFGAHQIAPGLLIRQDEVIGPALDPSVRADILAGAGVLDARQPGRGGQAIVVAGGAVLGEEPPAGTDALLTAVAAQRAHARSAPFGVLVKRPRPGQDLRTDMPVIGAETLRGAARAGLRGIALAPGRAMILDRPEVERLAEREGVFVAGLP